MEMFLLAVVLFTLALPILMFWYAWKQYLAIRTLRGGWQVLAWLPIAPVGYLLIFFVIPRIMNPGNLGPIVLMYAAFWGGFALLVALLFLSLLSIAHGTRRDQNIPPEDRHMRRGIVKAVAWAVGIAAFVVLALIMAPFLFPSRPDPVIQRDAYYCNQSGNLDYRIYACTGIIGRGGRTERCPAKAPCSQRNLASAYNNRGAAYDDKGDHARAIADHDEAIRLDPKNALLTNALLILHSFTGVADDGANPQGGLIFDGNGALYGTTESGGSRNAGTVFRLTPPAAGQMQWTKTVLWPQGMGSETRLIFDGNGALYGTAGDGTVFKLTPPAAGQTQWTKTTLHSFTDATPGLNPSGLNPSGLIFDGNGALYGTTYFGGSSNEGMVFMLTPPAAGQTQWTHTVLHSFTGGTDGLFPEGGLIFDGDGALYGTTTGGGSEKNGGTVFKLTPPAAGQTQWIETVLYSFSRGTDGWGPNGGLIFDRDGALYGTTALGGRISLSFFAPDAGDGTVFKLTPPAAGQTQWTETVLHSFTGENGDRGPHAGLIFGGDGALYGTTDGSGWAGGTVFKLTPPADGQTQWTETVLHSFTGGNDGSYPHGGSLIIDGNGALYGTTVFGGNSNHGTVYKLTGTKH